MKALFILSLTMLLLVRAIPSRAFPKMHREPSSIADSKKAKSFRGLAIASPDHFRWEDHDVAVHEAWLNKHGDGKTYLLFKLKIDGKFQMEHGIKAKEGKFLEFERADGRKPMLFFYNLSRGLFGQQRIYFLELPAERPKEIALNVNTVTTIDRKSLTRNTNITVRFRIPEASEEQEQTD